MVKDLFVQFVTKFVQGISHLFWILPYQIRHFLGFVLGFLWWSVFKFRRFTIYKNLKIVFPAHSHSQITFLAKKSLKWMGVHAIEFFLVPGLSKGRIQKYTKIIGQEHFDLARQQGKGVLLLSLHLGNADLALNILAKQGYPIWLITKVFKNPLVNKIWFNLRSNTGLKYISAHGKSTAYDIFKALSKNEAVIFVLDQFMGPPYGIETQFFNKKTGTAYGLSSFALKTKAPIVPVYTYQTESGVTIVQFVPEIKAPSELDGPNELSLVEKQIILTQSYNQALEQIIINHPEHWMWVHRRWKKWQIT